MAVDRNQPPIMNARILAGAILFTRDRPMGERQSSPTVMTAYVPTSHQEVALMAASLDWSERAGILSVDLATVTIALAALLASVRLPRGVPEPALSVG